MAEVAEVAEVAEMAEMAEVTEVAEMAEAGTMPVDSSRRCRAGKTAAPFGRLAWTIQAAFAYEASTAATDRRLDRRASTEYRPAPVMTTAMLTSASVRTNS